MEKTSGSIVPRYAVIGKQVVGTGNSKLGRMEEMFLDKVSGQVKYALLSLGIFKGIGSSFYTLPWKYLSYCTESRLK